MVARQIFILLGLLMMSGLLSAAGLVVQADRTQMIEGETLQLTIETDDSDNEPDTSGIENDFHITGSSRSSQVQIINGRMNSTTKLVYTLSPRRSGRLLIPALELNGNTSQPITIQVSKTRPSQVGDDLFIESSVDQQKPYLQSQITYSVRIFQAIDIREVALPTPELADFMIHILGDDVVYEAQREGRRYRVIERRYALFPQRSGRLTIPAPRMGAQIATGRVQRGLDPFSLLRQSAYRPVNIVGNEIDVNVLPKPGHVPEPWLPAQSLQVSEAWTEGEYRVGEPITRTVTLQARGLTGEQLPAITMQGNGDYKVYTDQAQVSTESQSIYMLGKRIEKIAIVPTHAGNIMLPKITLQWWNTQNKRLERATLPRKEFTALPAVSASSMAISPEPSPATKPLTTNSEAGTNPVPVADIITWPTYLMLALWLLTLGAWWWDRHHHNKPHRSANSTPQEVGLKRGKGRKRLKAICLTNNALAIRSALLAWAKEQWPDVPLNSLGAVINQLQDPAAINMIQTLDQSLYGHDDEEIDGEKLWQALENETASQLHSQKDTGLAPLYPN